MLILGWHGGLGLAETERTIADRSLLDSAAVLMRDGVVVAAAREEWFDRVPHSGAFPARSIADCLWQAGVGLEAVEAIVTDRSREALDGILFREAINDPRMPNLDPEDWVESLFRRHLGSSAAGRHHFCDAADASLAAAAEEMGEVPSVLACFGGEDRAAGDAVAARGGEGTSILARFRGDQSLSTLISWSEAVLGSPPFSTTLLADLAAQGDPLHFASAIDNLYRLNDDGTFSLAPENERMAVLFQTDLAYRLRRSGSDWRQLDRDFAAAIHAVLEKILLHVLAHARSVTGLADLCLAGPLANDLQLVATLAGAGLFSRVHPCPLTGGAAGALGAARWACRATGWRETIPTRTYSWGRDPGDDEALGVFLARWDRFVSARHLGDVAGESAALLASGLTVGWAQGRSEFLRRPWGNRAVLRTLAADMDARRQEAFYEAGPVVAVPRERAGDYFIAPPGLDPGSLGMAALRVTSAHRSMLTAFLSRDETVRVRLVDAAAAPCFQDLLESMEGLTGHPLLVESPLGDEGETRAETAEEALARLLAGDLDALVIGGWLVERERSLPAAAFAELAISLSPGHKLTRWRTAKGWRAAINRAGGNAFAGPEIRISPELAAALAGPMAAVGGECGASGLELRELWRRRAIKLEPA